MRNMNLMLATSAAAMAVGYSAPPAMADCAKVDSSVLLATGRSVLHNTPLNSHVLKLYNPGAILEVDDPLISADIIDPTLDVCGGSVDGYIGRPLAGSVEEITANQAQLTEYVGNTAISISNPQQAGSVVMRTLWPSPLKGAGPIGFTDGRTGYGFMPQAAEN